jgi:hypothetical protein
MALAEEISVAAECDPDDIIVYRYNLSNDLMRSAEAMLLIDKEPYYIKDASGHLREVDQYSSLSAKEKPRTFLYVYCPAALRNAVSECSPPIILDYFQ